jgi:hypothetical protein
LSEIKNHQIKEGRDLKLKVRSHCTKVLATYRTIDEYQKKYFDLKKTLLYAHQIK